MFRVLLTVMALLVIAPAIATNKPILTIYSYSSFLSTWGPGKTIKADFEAQCDCIVNIVTMGDGVGILNRLRLEGKATKADVILGLDTNLIVAAQKAELIQPHQLKRPANLTIDWWNDEFMPYDHGYFAFIYNRDKISIPPTNFDELLDNQYNWKIVYQDPRTSTPGRGLLLWINKIYGDKASDVWQRLAGHTLTVTKGWSESYGLFLKGEADFVLSYSTSPVVHVINDNDHRYQAAIFQDGNYQQIEVAAITRHTQQYDLAQQFLIFLLTPKVQKLLAEKNIMYPVINIPLPIGFEQLPPVTKPLFLNENDVFNHQKQWIKQWQNAVSK